MSIVAMSFGVIVLLIVAGLAFVVVAAAWGAASAHEMSNRLPKPRKARSRGVGSSRSSS